MSHDHTKKHHHHHDDGKKKKHQHHHGDDKGKLSDAMKNKDDDDETTPGFKGVSADSPKDITGYVVTVLAANDAYDPNLNKITVSVGKDDGVTENMTAYLIGADGTRYALAVGEVLDGTTHCYADLSEYFVQSQTSQRIVFNPSK